jgi:hypothetical protein
MNTSSSRSRLARLAAATLTALACGVVAAPALAVVDAPTGGYQVTLYQNSGCEGSTTYWQEGVPESGVAGYGVPDLGSFNDEASSWSICNNSGWTLWFTFNMWTNNSYGGTNINPMTRTELPSGMCFTGNHISPNDAVSSIGWYVYTTAS